MSWRPEGGWSNPHSTPTTSNELVNLQTFMWKLHGAAHRNLLADVFEAGADAMIEALKRSGIKLTKGSVKVSARSNLSWFGWIYDSSGYVIYIPKE